MDKINQNNQPFSDGVFDFAPLNFEGNKVQMEEQLTSEMDEFTFQQLLLLERPLKTNFRQQGSLRLLLIKLFLMSYMTQKQQHNKSQVKIGSFLKGSINHQYLQTFP